MLSNKFLYTDVSTDITENDLDVVSDLWDVDGREVYRGTRDPRYTHANVFWFYNENLERVGCAEHDLKDHANAKFLWFRDDEFGTMLQEDGWVSEGDIWSHLPQHVFDRMINEGRTTTPTFLEHCLHGPVRLVTTAMLMQKPLVYTCVNCGQKAFKPRAGCEMVAEKLDFPNKGKIFFVDDDLVTHRPPPNSSVWSFLTQPLHDGGSSQEQELVQELALEQTAPLPPPDQADRHTPPELGPEAVEQPAHETPAQSHP